MAKEPTPLPSALNLAVRIAQEFQHQRETGNESVRRTVVSYRYELIESRGREIFAYHYHPNETGPIKYPHLHVGAHDPRLGHGNKHLPPGLVTLEQIIYCLITEFDVPPLRTDWVDILGAGQSTIDAEGLS